MSIFDKVKEWNGNRKQVNELKKQIQNDETLTADEAAYFTEQTKQTPAEYKKAYEKLQAQVAENKRVNELKFAEKKYNIGGLVLRSDKSGNYYFSNSFDEHADKFILTNYQWNGPLYDTVSTTRTTGNDKKQGRAGSAIVGGVVAGPVGAVVGASRKKNTKVDRTSVTTTTQKELDTECILTFINVETSEKVFKTIKCNSSIIKEITKLSFTHI